MIQRMTTQVDYLLRETVTGLVRSGWMNWAAVSTLTALLFLLGLGLETSWQLEGAIARLGSQMEISVYLEPEIRYGGLDAQIRVLPGVIQVQGTSRETAWRALQKELGIQGDATTNLAGNPLVDHLRVRVDNPLAVAPLAARIKQLPGVADISYGSEAAERLARIQQALRWSGLAVTIILGTAAVTVIMTTIRLVILSRRKEIEVMQLVGATPLRIATPFVLEGLFFGALGTLFACGLLHLVSQLFEQKRQELLPFLIWQQSNPSLPPLPVVLLAIGSLLGVLGSLLAVRRVLK